MHSKAVVLTVAALVTAACSSPSEPEDEEVPVFPAATLVADRPLFGDFYWLRADLGGDCIVQFNRDPGWRVTNPVTLTKYNIFQLPDGTWTAGAGTDTVRIAAPTASQLNRRVPVLIQSPGVYRFDFVAQHETGLTAEFRGWETGLFARCTPE